MLLFCYGSNNPQQLADRLGRDVEVVSAYAEGYQRVYRGFSHKWGGGVASIIKMKGHTCYGLAAIVDKADIAQMDIYEGYPKSYSKKTIKGIVNGEEESMIAYIANAKEWNPPSTAYLKAIYKTVSTFWEVKSYKEFYNEY